MTTPWISGEWENAVKFTTRVEQRLDILEAALLRPLAGYARQTSTQNVVTSTWTDITFQVADVNVGSGFTVAGTFSEFTVPDGYDGPIMLYGIAVWAQNLTGARVTRFTKNGTAIPGSYGGPIPGTTVSNVVNAAPSVHGPIDAAAGDVFRLQSWQNSTITLATAINAGPAQSAEWATSVFGVFRAV